MILFQECRNIPLDLVCLLLRWCQKSWNLIIWIDIFLYGKVKNRPFCLRRTSCSLQVGCKVLHFFHMYMLGCNYFWMLCEGIYLHTLIVVAVFAEEQHLHWYYLLGWGESILIWSKHIFLCLFFFCICGLYFILYIFKGFCVLIGLNENSLKSNSTRWESI